MDLEEKIKEINDLLIDLEAAFLVTALFPKQKDKERILINFSGPSKRKWSTDISSAKLLTIKGGEDAITLNLNRPGIYDSLPEAFFHDFPLSDSDSGKEMANDSKKQKYIEKEARRFFRPIENELFFQSTRLSAKENWLIDKLNFSFLDGIIKNFWNTAAEVPQKYLSRFNKLLPYKHKVINNYNLVAQCLEYILDEKVSIELNRYSSAQDDDTHSQAMETFQLGDCVLGDDTIFKTGRDTFVGKVTITIGPLKNTLVSEFLTGGIADKLMHCFYDYYIPLELDPELNLLLEKEQSYFVLNDEEQLPHTHLGYSTVI